MEPKKSKDLLTQALLLGSGLMDLAQKKVEKSVQTIKKERNINRVEAEKMAQNFLAGFEKNKKEAGKILRDQIKKVIDELGLATKEDLKNLRKK